ncbi:hypothetical protein PoB_006073900 [Plakobranchus ocellatus]|uniref:Uncharacterized protein n=1 Tax=Plakobranchus ocellatus TaxID=259542 RepID=A0AAV4CQQ8_9GAST|nr:hypothetical protein PoB_006073900 [Plakobranchus ocellatus]
MNGCDLAHQIVSYFGLQKRRSFKWWKNIFHWMFKITTNNAQKLYVLTRPPTTKKKLLQLKFFKLQCIEQLAEAAAELAPNNATVNTSRGRPGSNPVGKDSVAVTQKSKDLARLTGQHFIYELSPTCKQTAPTEKIEMEQLVEDYLRGREAIPDRREKSEVVLIPDNKEKDCCACPDCKHGERKEYPGLLIVARILTFSCQRCKVINYLAGSVRGSKPLKREAYWGGMGKGEVPELAMPRPGQLNPCIYYARPLMKSQIL